MSKLLTDKQLQTIPEKIKINNKKAVNSTKSDEIIIEENVA